MHSTGRALVFATGLLLTKLLGEVGGLCGVYMSVCVVECMVLSSRLLVGSPWSGSPDNRKGDIYKCDITGPGSSCERLNLQSKMAIFGNKNILTNPSKWMICSFLVESTLT